MSRGGTFEKRREKRSRRRLRVVFEVDGAHSGGYTTNVSLRGMQATGAVVFPTGTVLKGTIELPDGRLVPFDAKVRWAIKGAGTFATLHQKSMGLQLIGVPPRELFELLENARDEEVPAPSSPPTPPTPDPRPSEPASITIGRTGAAQLTIPEAGPLTLPAATELVERAVRAAVDDLLSADQEIRGVKLVLTIMDTEPVPAGSIVQAVARVEGSSDGGKLVDFAVDLSELGRPLGKASYTMLVMRRRR